jgi:hypothetical protein
MEREEIADIEVCRHSKRMHVRALTEFEYE